MTPTFEYRHGIATVSDGDAQLRITRFRAEHRDDSVRAELIATCAGRGLARAAWNLRRAPATPGGPAAATWAEKNSRGGGRG